MTTPASTDKVKRWSIPRGTTVAQHERGEWVEHHEYDALLSERDGLRRALERLVAANEQRGIDALMDVAAALPDARAALRSAGGV